MNSRNQKNLSRTNNSKPKRYGSCIICGDRVESSDSFVTAEEGYCHQNCLKKSQITKVQRIVRRNEKLRS